VLFFISSIATPFIILHPNSGTVTFHKQNTRLNGRCRRNGLQPATASLKSISTQYPCPRTVLTARGHGSPFFHTRVHEPCPCTRVSKNYAHPWTRASIHRRPKSPRAVDTGVFFDTRVQGHGPWTRVSKLSFLTSVDTGIVCIYRA